MNRLTWSAIAGRIGFSHDSESARPISLSQSLSGSPFLNGLIVAKRYKDDPKRALVAEAVSRPKASASVGESVLGGGAKAVTSIPDYPSASVARVVGIAIAVHAALIVISYLAVVRSSTLQGRVIDGFAPYLSSLHLAPEGNTASGVSADGVALYLARGDGAERTYRLQFKAGTGRDESGWIDADFGGNGGGEGVRRYQRYLAAVAELAESSQNGLAARLMLPLVAKEGRSDSVRIIRLSNLMTNVAQDSEPAPYSAVILRGATGTRLVRVPEPRLTAASTL
jgi:hypothetical protein